MRIFLSALVFLPLLATLSLIDGSSALAKPKRMDAKKQSEVKSPVSNKAADDQRELTLTQTGGFVSVHKSCHLRLAELSEGERQQLEKLIEQSGLASVQKEERLTKGGADMFYYELILRTGKKEQRVLFDDGSLPQSYRPLIQFLRPKLIDQKR